MQLMDLPALSEELESALEGWDSKPDLSGEQAGASCLQMEDRRARSATGIGSLGDVFEQLTRSSIFPFVEGEVCLLQNRRDVLRKSLSYLTTEHTAHSDLSIEHNLAKVLNLRKVFDHATSSDNSMPRGSSLGSIFRAKIRYPVCATMRSVGRMRAGSGL
jgi:hypothetical protein